MGKEVVNYGSAVNDGTGEAVHEAAAKIDAGARLFGVIDKDLTAPPGSPAIGDCYIVGASATGAWATHDGKIAVYGLDSTWLFVAPNEGVFAYVRDEKTLYRHEGSAWGRFSSGKVEFSIFAAGTLSNDETIYRLEVTRPFSLPSGLTGSRGSSGAAATGTPALSIKKNGAEVGTATWSAAGSTATLAMVSSTSFAIGDILAVSGPATADATLADISLSILGDLV